MDTDTVTIPAWADDPIGHRWLRFHHAHPEVGEALVHLAREWRDSTSQRCGMKMLWERLRWAHAVGDISPGRDFKLNNVYTALYARWLMETHADLAGVFVTRQRLCDGAPPPPPPQPANGAHGANGAASQPLQPVELPTLWMVLGPNGRSRHLIRRSLEHDPEVEALCGLSGEPRRGPASMAKCGSCLFRISQLTDGSES